MPRDVSIIVQELQEALKAAEARNQTLQQQISEAEKQTQEAQRRAELAEEEAQQIHEKLSRLELLRDTQYQSLIKELFEVPSRKAARLTVIVAVISICVGTLTAIGGTILAARDNTATVQSLRHEAAEAMRRVEQAVLKEIRQSEGRMQSRLPPDFDRSSYISRGGFQQIQGVTGLQLAKFLVHGFRDVC